MATHKLALIIQNPSNQNEFLLIKQSRPPKFNDEEYDSFLDSDLWDLPSVQLNPLQPQSDPPVEVQISVSHSDEFDFSEFDIHSALKEVVLLNFGLFWIIELKVVMNLVFNCFVIRFLES